MTRLFGHVVCVTVALTACKTPPARDPAPSFSQPSPLEAIAAAVDGEPQEPIWNTLPDTRAELERSAAAPATATARLAAAQTRLTNWQLDLAAVDPAVTSRQFLTGLEGVFL